MRVPGGNGEKRTHPQVCHHTLPLGGGGAATATLAMARTAREMKLTMVSECFVWWCLLWDDDVSREWMRVVL